MLTLMTLTEVSGNPILVILSGPEASEVEIRWTAFGLLSSLEPAQAWGFRDRWAARMRSWLDRAVGTFEPGSGGFFSLTTLTFLFTPGLLLLALVFWLYRRDFAGPQRGSYDPTATGDKDRDG